MGENLGNYSILACWSITSLDIQNNLQNRGDKDRKNPTHSTRLSSLVHPSVGRYLACKLLCTPDNLVHRTGIRTCVCNPMVVTSRGPTMMSGGVRKI